MQHVKRLIYTVALAFLGFTIAQGQEAGVFTHYYINPFQLNVGAVGFKDAHDILFSYRNQWSAFDGAPRSFALQYSGRVADQMGVGGRVFMDRIGQYRALQGEVSYAYRIDMNELSIGIGLSAGFQQLRLASVNDDPFLDQSDQLLNEALDGVILFDGSLGFYGEYSERLFFGFSMPDLIQTRLTSISEDIDDPNEEFNYAIFLGYRFGVDNESFTIEPSVAIKNIRRVPFNVDFNVKLAFLDEQLVGGLTYSVGEESRLGVLLGTRVDKFRFFYSYDVNFGDFQQFNNGSHEITIQFTLPRGGNS